MTEQNRDTLPPGTAGDGQVFEITRIYLKDVSFESPLTPRLFIGQIEQSPEFNVQLNAQSQGVGDDLYEVVLSITASAQLGSQTAWLVEIKQAGVFRIAGFERAELAQMLGSFCPNTLYPFAREAVADLINKGGLPSFYLAPISFDALYAEHVEKLRRESAASPDGG